MNVTHNLEIITSVPIINKYRGKFKGHNAQMFSNLIMVY